MQCSTTSVSAPKGTVVQWSSRQARATTLSSRGQQTRPLRAMASTDPAAAAATPSESGVTVEYQRQQAKAMQAYLRNKTLQQEIVDAQVFGWTRKNEISNGRWVMMGLAIGMLTEYATGVSFIDQIRLMVSYLGIVDIE